MVQVLDVLLGLDVRSVGLLSDPDLHSCALSLDGTTSCISGLETL